VRIVQGDEIPLERALQHRGGTFHYRRVLEGEPGSPGNFQLSVGVSEGDFASPRHKHNFEQFRFQIEGTLDFASDGAMRPGMVGYFPESVSYGPQSQDPAEQTLTAVLQFGGASGSGYLSPEQVEAARAELQEVGRFEKGVFRRNDGGNVDGYQAIWEHVNKRPLEYPRPRYEKPVFMDPEAFAWVRNGETGVEEKLLGVFTERGSAVRFVRLEPDAEHEAAGRTIYFAVEGAGSVNGESVRPLSSVYLETGERARVRAETPLVLLALGLPELSGLS
jgi:hypothetical protein